MSGTKLRAHNLFTSPSLPSNSLGMEHMRNRRDASAHRVQFSGRHPVAARHACLVRRGVRLLRVFGIAIGESSSLCFSRPLSLTGRPRQLEKPTLQLRQSGGQQLSKFTRDFVQSAFPHRL